MAEFVNVGGQSGQAWVIGRDDSRDVALLRIANPSQSYQALSLATDTTIQIDEELAVLSFPDAVALTVDKRTTRVVGVRQDLNTGFSYLQIQATPQAGAEGGVLIDSAARIRGLRMAETQMTKLGLGRASEVYAMAAAALSGTLVPQLQNGLTLILPPDSSITAGSNPGGPPPIPATYFGTVAISGEKPSTTVRLYIQVSKAGLPDLWFNNEVKPAAQGEYLIAVGITTPGYDGATIRFWAVAKQADQTAIYSPGSFQTINLTFQ